VVQQLTKQVSMEDFFPFLPFEKFFNKIGLKKISYGYASFSEGNDRNLIFLSDKNFSKII